MNFVNKWLETNTVPDFLLRAGIRQQLADRLKLEYYPTRDAQLRRKMAFIEELKSMPIAVHQSAANEQHYELPIAFFSLCLGRRLKYSGCLFEASARAEGGGGAGHGAPGAESLDDAEEAMLRTYCQRAGLKDGMEVLDMGCGWGSLSLYVAEFYPNCKITSLSNSHTQREFIEGVCKKKSFKNVVVETNDVTKWTTSKRFDRVFSVEMFEHMKNYERLLEKVYTVLKPGGKFFAHVFTHKEVCYHFESEGENNWMGKYFFTGGTMMSDDLFAYFQKHLTLTNHWVVDGRHYAQTCEMWLQNMDRHIDKIRVILRGTYGEANARKWEAYWRTFYVACAELFGYNCGQEWFVSHYLFEKSH